MLNAGETGGVDYGTSFSGLHAWEKALRKIGREGVNLRAVYGAGRSPVGLWVAAISRALRGIFHRGPKRVGAKNPVIAD